MESNKKSIISRVVSILIIGFFLNLLWEVLHNMLYGWDEKPLINDIYIYIPRITFFASGMDAFWIFSFIIVNSLIQQKMSWIKKPQRRDYYTFLLLGIITAILIEVQANMFNQWTYNEYIPIIFGIGFTPLIQLATTSVISLFLSSHIQWKTSD